MGGNAIKLAVRTKLQFFAEVTIAKLFFPAGSFFGPSATSRRIENGFLQ
jgi:hypothetical protein